MGEERGGKVGQTENRTQGGTGREIFKGNVDVIETLFYEITFEICNGTLQRPQSPPYISR